MAGIGRVTDDFSRQVILVEHRFRDIDLVGIEHHEHALLALGQHDLVGCHAFFALGHLVQVHDHADAFAILAAAGGHLDRGGGQASSAHVLDCLNGVCRHQFEAGLDQQLLGERVANLHGRALLLVALGEFGRRHGRAMDAVAPGLRSDIEDRISGRRAAGIENLVLIGEADGHRIDEDVAIIAFVELGFPGHGRHAHTVSVSADARDHARHEAAGLGMVRGAEAQCIDQRDRARAHGEDIAQDAAHARRRALIRLDIGRVVVALHLEDGSLAVTNVDDAGILAGALDDAVILGREFGQMTARGFVRAML